MATFPQNIQDAPFIVSLTHSISTFLLCKLVQSMHSTNAARLDVVRNVKIIIILEQPEVFVVVFLALQI